MARERLIAMLRACRQLMSRDGRAIVAIAAAPAGETNVAPISLTAPEPADVVTGGLRSQPAALPRPSTGAQSPTPLGLPIPALADSARGAGIRCVVTPVDRDGRLADRSVVTFLGWPAGAGRGIGV
jgi:hypothetical protein